VIGMGTRQTFDVPGREQDLVDEAVSVALEGRRERAFVATRTWSSKRAGAGTGPMFDPDKRELWERIAARGGG
jgi:hypothetical protein